MCDSIISTNDIYAVQLHEKAIYDLERKILSKLIKLGENPETFDDVQISLVRFDGEQEKDRKELIKLISILRQTEKNYSNLYTDSR